MSRIEDGSFSKCGSCLNAANTRFEHLQEFHGSRPVPLQNVALALAPRTFVLNRCKSFTDSHDQRTRNGVLEGFRTMRAQKLC
eukprot:2941227-Pyramimonas_sp.AAC.1